MLDYIITHGKLREKVARKFARQVASALDYCHRNCIAHRNLKLEDILISKAGHIKLIDFGSSALFLDNEALRSQCGSSYFPAPEIIAGVPYRGPEIDVWSFGIILYTMVCGKVPFDGYDIVSIHTKIRTEAVSFPPWLSNGGQAQSESSKALF